jgi:uncharacterized caspase-like protein
MMQQSMMHKFLKSLITVFLLTTSTTLHARVYLVSVGITDYPGTSMDLALPAKDAETISWLYSKNTSVVKEQLLNENATMQNIISSMRRTFAQAGTDDIVVLFFSGHGYPGGFVAYDGQLTYTQVRKAMATSKCKNKMIFADACFSGKIRTNGNSSQTSVQAAKKANVMLFLSSRSNETSIERRGMQNGFFTTYLQKGLRGGADANRDRVITAKELYDYVHKGVIEISRDKQHPVMWGKFNDNMPVMTWPKKK